MWKTLKVLLPSKSGYNNCTAFSPDEFNDYFSTIGNTLESHLLLILVCLSLTSRVLNHFTLVLFLLLLSLLNFYR